MSTLLTLKKSKTKNTAHTILHKESNTTSLNRIIITPIHNHNSTRDSKMPGPKRGFTAPRKCATVDSLARNQPSERDRKAREKLQEKVSDFQVTFDDNVYLSLGLEAK